MNYWDQKREQSDQEWQLQVESLTEKLEKQGAENINLEVKVQQLQKEIEQIKNQVCKSLLRRKSS